MPSEQRVTSLELFFDLVFVFAITQVTGFISEDPTWTRLFEGLAILAALWWAWVSYAWLANTANSDEGVMRVVLLAAMGAMLIASLAVPHAFGRDGVIFGLAYLVVRLLHLGAYEILAREDPELRSLVGRLGARSSRPPCCWCWPASSTAPLRRSAGSWRWRWTTGAWRCGAPRAGTSLPVTSPSATG